MRIQSRLISKKNLSLKNRRLILKPAENSCSPIYCRKLTLRDQFFRMGPKICKPRVRKINRKRRASLKQLLAISIIICAGIKSKSTVSLIKFKFINVESTMKVFNTYVQFCSLSYWGPQGGPQAPKIGGSSGQDQVAESSVIQNIIQKQQKEKTRFQVTAFDILFNPLRQNHTFGKF